ncbi:MAG: DUF4163 domain-containing protein [Firmicutes bacterium]|nr:DUF4163 domain-containing protein [Bacillota bacterium]
MTKKIVFLILTMILAMNISACDSNTSNTDGNEVENYSITESNSSSNEGEISYSINYPQITGLSDTEKQDKVNNIIKEEALKVLKYYENPFAPVEVDIDYNITLQEPSVLSIQYSGLGIVSGVAHPNKLFYTTNIDIERGTRIRLKDIININSDFIQKFIGGDFTAVNDEQGQNIDLSTLSVEDLQREFTEADSLDNIGTENQSDVYSYLTEDSLGISISVPYAVGGHAEYEINYQDLNEFIKSDSEIWKDLLKN